MLLLCTVGPETGHNTSSAPIPVAAMSCGLQGRPCSSELLCQADVNISET